MIPNSPWLGKSDEDCKDTKINFDTSAIGIFCDGRPETPRQDNEYQNIVQQPQNYMANFGVKRKSIEQLFEDLNLNEKSPRQYDNEVNPKQQEHASVQQSIFEKSIMHNRSSLAMVIEWDESDDETLKHKKKCNESKDPMPPLNLSLYGNINKGSYDNKFINKDQNFPKATPSPPYKQLDINLNVLSKSNHSNESTYDSENKISARNKKKCLNNSQPYIPEKSENPFKQFRRQLNMQKKLSRINKNLSQTFNEEEGPRNYPYTGFYYPTPGNKSFNRINKSMMVPNSSHNPNLSTSFNSSGNNTTMISESSIQSGGKKNSTRRKRCEINEDETKISPEKCMDDQRTTIMIRHIPNKYTKEQMLETIDKNHKNSYNFFYLPMDFKNKCNIGYAFINFVDEKYVKPFFQEFNNKRFQLYNSNKICNIRYARIQGLEELKRHFEFSSVLAQQDKSFKPYLGNSLNIKKDGFKQSELENIQLLVQKQKENSNL